MALSVLATGTTARAESSTAPWIELEPRTGVEAPPGSFATASVDVFNPSQETIEFVLRAIPPDGWRALTIERLVRLEGGAGQVVPFTAWVPSFSRAESPYTMCVQAHDPAGRLPVIETALPLRVAAVAVLTVELAAVDAHARPGETARHVVRLRNSGNCACMVEWRAGSIPAWPLDRAPETLHLEAGTDAWLDVGVRVPPEASAGAIHLLDLVVTATPLDARIPPVTERVQARVTVMAPAGAPGRHAALPIEASLSTGEIGPGAHSQGFRLATRGEAIEGGEVEAEFDLVAGERAKGVQGWQRQHWAVGLSRGGWNARAGDVIAAFPELAVQTSTLRGGGIQIERPFGTIRAVAGRNRTTSATGWWGLGLSRPIGSGGQRGGDLVVREDDRGRGLRRTTLLCFTGQRTERPGTTLRLETSLSRSATGHRDHWGAAGQLSYDHLGDRVQMRARALLGGNGYDGRVRDRDGLSGYLLYLPRPHLGLWSSLDAADGKIWPVGPSPRLRTLRYRAGGRYTPGSWPVLEVTAAADRDRAARADTLRDLDRRTLGLSISRTMGGMIVSTSGQWGSAYNPRTDRAGAVRTLDLVCGGRFASARAALQLQHTDDWNPQMSSRLETTNWTADLAWNSPSHAVQAGLALSTRRVNSALSSPTTRRDHRLGPRLDLGLRPGVRLRADASLLGIDRTPRLDRWQLQLSFSGEESVPLPWRPVRGEVHGVLFVDEDNDGEPDAGEPRIQGVVLRVDGRTLVTDEAGLFELPALEPGSYWLELNRSSLPATFVPRDPLPIEIRIEPGDERWIRVPLVPSGAVSGRIFLDTDHDGVRGRGEEGLRDLRVLLVQGGTRVADGLTDAEGRYQMAEVPPGEYEVSVAEGWLPDGWIVTTGSSLKVTLGAGERAEARAYGVAPRPRPVIRTYQGGGD